MKKYVENDIKKALIELCQNEEFDNITIKELCGKCQITKQTFYNHFVDKYEVVEKIYLDDLLYDEYKNEKYSKDILLRALNNLWANRIFYRNVLNSTKQNSLNQFARQNDVNALTHFMTIKNVEITEQVKFIMLYRSYGFINSVHEWVKGNLIFSPEEFADLLVETMPTYITDLWD